MTINVIKEVDVPFSFQYKKLAEKVILAAMDQEEFPYEAEVNLTLVDNESIHQINLEHRQMDRATDVLSFPLVEYETPGDFDVIEEGTQDVINPDTEEVMLGDIVISVDKVLEQASEFGHSPKREYAFLIVHSMLHLFGYDHMEESEAAVMEAKQRQILDVLQIYR